MSTRWRKPKLARCHRCGRRTRSYGLQVTSIRTIDANTTEIVYRLECSRCQLAVKRRVRSLWSSRPRMTFDAFEGFKAVTRRILGECK
jgi:transcription elongation factor Elf1